MNFETAGSTDSDSYPLGRLQWSEQIHLFRANKEMVALAGPSKLEVFYVSPNDRGETSFSSLSTFHLGTSISAMSWSSSSFSPTFPPETNQWQFRVEMVVAVKDGSIRILSSSPGEHHDLSLSTGKTRVNDLAWSEAEGYEHLIAAAHEDGRLQIFELSSSDQEPNPACYTFSFPNPLISTSFHASLPNLILVSDSRGVSTLVNYEESRDNDSIKSLVTLKDPKSLSLSSTLAQRSQSLMQWKKSDSNLLASFNDGSWRVWDLRKISGGNPTASGKIYEKGAIGTLRWGTNPRLLAILVSSSTFNPSQSVSTSISSSHPISILDSSFPNAPRRIPRSLLTSFPSSSLTDLDWLDTSSISNPLSPLKDQDVLIVAMGKEIVFVSASSARAE